MSMRAVIWLSRDRGRDLCAAFGAMMRMNPKSFYEKYFAQFPGVYTVGDGARKDEDGYILADGPYR